MSQSSTHNTPCRFSCSGSLASSGLDLLSAGSSLEVDIHTIRSVETKVQQHVRESTHLELPGNSLFDLSECLAPEILGHIFWWNVISGVSLSGRIARDTFNFLLVCRRWFGVATSTPSLWAFWGTSLRECLAFYRYSGDVPLYLNLVESNTSRDIREAGIVFQDPSVRRRIRDLHVHTSPKTLARILSSMSTPQQSPVRSQIQSLMLTVGRPCITELSQELPDITNFLDTHSLPDLRSLHLHGCVLRWDSLIPQTSKLTRLFIHVRNEFKKPTVLQLITLFSRNRALEQISLSLEIVPTLDNPLPDSSASVFLPHLRRLAVYGNAAGHAQLLNLLTFSNELEHVDTDLFLDGIVTDVAAALTPFLPNLFINRRPSDLAVHITYIMAGLSINVLQPGERDDTEDFLVLKISSRDMGFWGVSPALPEEVIKRLPTANVTGLNIRRYSAMFRQDFRHLFQATSAVREFCIMDSAIDDIVRVLASPSPIEEEDEPTHLPHLQTFRLKDINFALPSHANTAAHLGRLLEQRYKDGLPLSKLSMAYCPHFSWGACSAPANYLKDHLCWDRYEAAGGRRSVCETCHSKCF